MTMATSLTIGDAMRKLMVTPSGTPAATKPMKAGTAEHEQNGVTTPEPGGSHVADPAPAATEQRTGPFDRHEAAQRS